jgi:hypothetical protein
MDRLTEARGLVHEIDHLRKLYYDMRSLCAKRGIKLTYKEYPRVEHFSYLLDLKFIIEAELMEEQDRD